MARIESDSEDADSEEDFNLDDSESEASDGGLVDEEEDEEARVECAPWLSPLFSCRMTTSKNQPKRAKPPRQRKSRPLNAPPRRTPQLAARCEKNEP